MDINGLQTKEQVTKWKLQSTNQMKNYGKDTKTTSEQ